MLTLIIPCYNEEAVLPLFHEEATKVLSAMDTPYELLFVNDGSRDKTFPVLKELARQDSHVRYLSFSRNFGKEAAMYAGFCNAKGDYVAVLDADLQDPPALLPQMLEILRQGEYDSVATRRVTRSGEPPIRSWFARRFYSVINRISDAEIVDGARDFRLMTREMVDAIVSMCENNRFSKGIYGWIGFRTYWLPYENIERAAGETKWSFWSLLKYALSGIISFSNAPLSIPLWLGIATMAGSGLMGVILLICALSADAEIAGWLIVLCVLLFFMGLQLVCIGLLGQYLGKTYNETKHRPHYIVAESNIDGIRRIG